jgi:AraC family transcriptional regulator of adaptative response/methylated-DNA-[protein]-cysteine methyltransferase
MQAPTIIPIPTTAGTFVARYSAHGLARLDFPSARGVKSRKVTAPQSTRAWHITTTRAVKSILAGNTPLELPPMDLSGGTDFQRRVWEELMWIPCGETRSYSEIAKAIGRPKANRAVGGACGANPIPLLIPCHRVLAANGRIGGFSGGLEWKRQLLQIEGIDAP